jgi:hypothetical protein
MITRPGKLAIAPSWTTPACHAQRVSSHSPVGYGGKILTPMLSALSYRGATAASAYRRVVISPSRCPSSLIGGIRVEAPWGMDQSRLTHTFFTCV